MTKLTSSIPTWGVQSTDSAGQSNFRMVLLNNRPMGGLAKLFSSNGIREDQVQVRSFESMICGHCDAHARSLPAVLAAYARTCGASRPAPA